MNMGKFAWGDPFVTFGNIVGQPPKYHPHETQQPRRNEGPLPTINQRDPWHEQRSEKSAEVGTGIEESSGQCTFSFWKPLGHGFDRSGKVSCFTQSKNNP